MIYFPEQINDSVAIGGKAEALAHLALARFPVPEWFVLSPDAFRSALNDEHRTSWQDYRDYAEIQDALAQLSIPSALQNELETALQRLCPQGEPVAVRSSALDEDGAEHSFAGQLDSILFVEREQLAERVLQVWRSGFSERLYAYRKENGLSLPPEPPAVLIQRMVDADCAGVAFSADPVSGRRSTSVVAAVYGLGSALVAGTVDADSYYVNRDLQITERNIVLKRQAHAMDSQAEEGVSLITVDDIRAKKPALSNAQIVQVAKLARACERHFHCPQDIEWAIYDNELYLLQSRPITSLRNLPDPDASLTIWDNSNIAESYRGVTTPLTFSFASRVYAAVYREFCHMMRVPDKVIEAHDDTFARMLGIFKGQVYYNLISWYEVLAMLPGFAMNRQFMEQMMGVREPMPDEVIQRLAPRVGLTTRLRDAFRLLSTVAGLLLNHIVIERRINEFYKRFNHAMQAPSVNLAQMRADELLQYYHSLERQLLRRWDAPLVNDFFAMIFYGVLRKLTEKWCDDQDGSLQNDLLVGEGDIISAEPAQRIRKMAEMIMLYPEFVELLCEGGVAAIYQQITEYREFNLAYQAYLSKFGDRCLDELKLESPTLHDNPLPVLRSIGHMARRLLDKQQEAPGEPRAQRQQRHQAEDHVQEMLSGRPLRRRLFRWVLKHARARVSARENLRFERTRLFGRVRQIFVETGHRFADRGIIQRPRDIFYLQLDEIVAYIEGRACTQNLAVLVQARRAEFKDFKISRAPSDRFETRGLPYHAHDYQSVVPAQSISGDEIKGTACCPGVVRGPVRVVRDPRGVELRPGEILVAERTDPGWIMLFPAAAGLLVEHGSLLSHSAIVAREMGIPAVVALAGVTDWLVDGDWIEMDGRLGTVKRIKNEADEVSVEHHDEVVAEVLNQDQEVDD